jgi:hypothetical protein
LKLLFIFFGIVLSLFIISSEVTGNTCLMATSLEYPVDKEIYIENIGKEIIDNKVYGYKFWQEVWIQAEIWDDESGNFVLKNVQTHHLAEDIKLPEKTPVRAIGNGKIVYYEPASGYGELVVVIEHDLGKEYEFTNGVGDIVKTQKILSIYGHLRKSKEREGTPLKWEVGNCVKKGEIIGYVNDDANNGWGAEHLHMGIRLSDKDTALKRDKGYWFRGYDTYKGTECGTSCGEDFAAASMVIEKLRATRFMDFEDGVDGAVIRSKIPGMTFTSTEGYDWIYSDIRTGKYNYPFYWVNGNFCAWLGPYQGVGRIDFIGATAKTISLSYSGYYTVYLEAYDSQGNLIDSVSGPPNTGTGRMDRLSVSGLNIAYVLIHDLGNYWIIDDLEVSDLLAETRVNLPANFAASHEEIDTVNQGESKWKLFLNKIIQTMRIILGWSGSELSIRVYRPDGTFYNEYQSDTSPIIIDIKNAEPGEWQFEVVAKDVPRSNYPFALIVGLPDVDGDGKADQDDNCPNTYNPDQADSDKNGIGDACEIIPGDLDNDGDVDQNDLNILLSYRNKPASACPKCDLDGDGMITVLDARKLVLLCTRPRCATE